MDIKKLRDRYTETALLEARKEINRDQRIVILKALQAEAYAAGITSEELAKIADDGVNAAMEIMDGVFFQGGKLQ